jgi:hypothetical protein
MINLESAVLSENKTYVIPSDNIFQELGNNTYDLKDILSELIDNSIAARYENQILSVNLIFMVNINGVDEFIIKDNAQGIKRNELGVCISPAARQTLGKLNEHGLGMKQSIAAMGSLNYLASKTKEDEIGVMVKNFKFGEIETYDVNIQGESGTIISVKNTRPILTLDNSTMRSLKLYLGARYRRYLKPNNKKLKLTIEKRRSWDNQMVEFSEITEVNPVYFHPNRRSNAPIIQNYEINGAGWSAELSFGYAPSTINEYLELGIEQPKNYHPYNVSLAKQGLDIILQDRVILFSQLSDKDFGEGGGIVSKSHPNYNSIRGEIVLKEGFKTAITKNSIIRDANFKDCISKIKKILEGSEIGPDNKIKDYLKTQTFSDDLPEVLLRDRLANWLSTNPIQPKTQVNKEYAVEGIEGYIDIFADGEVWELKNHPANALDVYQLFMYMDISEIKKGFLVAKSFTNGAKIAVENIERKHGKKIICSELSQFPINELPNLQEREDYF